MTLVLSPGVHVEHSSWGLGKIVQCDGAHVIVYFPSLLGSSVGPRRKLQVGAPQLRVSTTQSDPALDAVPLGRAKAAKTKGTTNKASKTQPKRTLHTVDQAILWFQTAYPKLFRDPKLVSGELTYKREAHDRWEELFGRGRGRRLLRENRFEQIGAGLDEVHHATNIPSRFEIMAAHDGYKNRVAAARVLKAVLDLIDDCSADTFTRLIDAVGSLPAPAEGSRVLTWPNATILPFLGAPERFMVVKPAITRRVADRMGVDIMYSSAPSWHCYERVLGISAGLLEQLSGFGAKDYIDVQSFMWVTRDLE